MEKQVWVEKYGNLYLVDKQKHKMPKLKVGVYEVNYGDMLGFSLNPISDNFQFGYKIYGLETRLIKRVLKYYSNTGSGNLGILLNGIRGTGKTVTSKIICNKLNLPVIVVSTAFPAVEDYLNSIPQDIVVFVDEYEKIFQKSHEFLTIMDGALNSEYRRVFILTTNNLYVDQNLLDRPSRIRYLQTFGDLTPMVVEEIVDDILKYPEFKDECIKYISTLEIITVDIVKAVINEVNIHGESPNNFKEVFNVSIKKGKYKVSVIENDKVKATVRNANLNMRLPFGERTIGNSCYVNNEYIGEVCEIINFTTIKILLPKPDENEDDIKELSPLSHPNKNFDNPENLLLDGAINIKNQNIVTLKIEEDFVYNDSYMYGGTGPYKVKSSNEDVFDQSW